MPADVLDALKAHVITPVVRESDAGRARLVTTGLRRAGFRVFEITLTVPGAMGLIRELAAEGDVTVGVGTVFTADDARLAAAAGARFVVTPAALPDVASAAHGAGAAAILGALTPTEIVAARRAGADAVKIFPVSSVGGATHVKALANVFPDVPLIPTGGIDLPEMRSHLDAGAHSIGVGGALTRGRTEDDVEAAGREYLATLGRHAAPDPKEYP